MTTNSRDNELETPESVHYNFNQLHTITFKYSLLSASEDSVSLMAEMISNLKLYDADKLAFQVFLLMFFLLGFGSSCWSENQEISDAVVNIFLKKQFNSTDSEWILKSARESYLYLKWVEERTDVDEKLNFVKNYANFLLELFKEVLLKNFDIHTLFLRQSSFLKEYNHNQTGRDFNITELKAIIESFHTTVEQHLPSHFNATKKHYEALEVLALSEANFDAFLREKIRTEFSEIGYFFLEVFATLIGLSWGIISTVIHYTQSNTENIY